MRVAVFGNRKRVLEALAFDNGALRRHLRTWDALLIQVGTGNHLECQHAISVLQQLCRRFERWNHRRFQAGGLYKSIEKKFPDRQHLLDELRDELKFVRCTLREFRRELALANSSRERHEIRRVGEELAQTLRRHIHGEETGLFPLVSGRMAAGGRGQTAVPAGPSGKQAEQKGPRNAGPFAKSA